MPPPSRRLECARRCSAESQLISSQFALAAAGCKTEKYPNDVGGERVRGGGVAAVWDRSAARGLY